MGNGPVDDMAQVIGDMRTVDWHLRFMGKVESADESTPEPPDTPTPGPPSLNPRAEIERLKARVDELESRERIRSGEIWGHGLLDWWPVGGYQPVGSGKPEPPPRRI